MSIHDTTREERIQQTLADWDAMPMKSREKCLRRMVEINMRLSEVLVPMIENNGITAYQDAMKAIVASTDKLARKADRAIRRSKRLIKKLRERAAELGVGAEIEALVAEEVEDNTDETITLLDEYAALPPLPSIDPALVVPVS